MVKKIVKEHSEAVLIACAIVLVAVIGWYFFATVSTAFTKVEDAIEPPPSAGITGFDLQDAARIDFRGIMNGSNAGAPAGGGLPSGASSSSQGSNSPVMTLP